MNDEPFVSLIKKNPSHGPDFIDELYLMRYAGRPALHWSVCVDAGTHYDGGCRNEIIPYELLPDLTAESLTNWMLRTLSSWVLGMADFASYAQDQRVIDWCAQIRELYAPAAVPTEPAAESAAETPPSAVKLK